MARNCHSKKKRNLRLLVGDSSLPCSCSGPSHAMPPAPMRFKLSYIPFPLFCGLVCSDQWVPCLVKCWQAKLVPRFSLHRREPWEQGCLNRQFAKATEVFLVYLHNNTKNGCGAEVFASFDCFLSVFKVHCETVWGGGGRGAVARPGLPHYLKNCQLVRVRYTCMYPPK